MPQSLRLKLFQVGLGYGIDIVLAGTVGKDSVFCWNPVSLPAGPQPFSCSGLGLLGKMPMLPGVLVLTRVLTRVTSPLFH